MSIASENLRCSRCILPGSYPNIKFDEEGVCNHCRSYKQIPYKGEDALRETLNLFRNKGKEYDCLVPVSGGMDSTFMLHQIKNVYNMRALAFHYDNPFTPEKANENLIRAVNALNVDFVSVKSEVQKRYLGSTIASWLRRPNSFPVFCAACYTACLGGAYRVATAKEISLIVWGQSTVENSLVEAPGRYHKVYPLHLLKKFASNPFYFSPSNIRDFLITEHVHFPSKQPENVELIRFFEYAEYDQETMLSAIQKIGWRKPQEEAWRSDCMIHPIKEYVLRRRLGFSDKDEYYSNLIRNNKMKRDEALRRIEQATLDRESFVLILNRVFEKIGIPKKAISNILYS